MVKEDTTTLLLEINHDPSSYVKSYLRDGDTSFEPTTLADLNIKKAIAESENFVNEWSDSLLELVTYIRNQLKFVYYEMDSESLAYSAFEALNSRGLPVPRLDSVKSMLMSKIFAGGDGEHHIEELRGSWATIYESIGTVKELGSSVLRYAATLRHLSKGKPHTETYSAHYLVDNLHESSDIIDRSNWIRSVSGSMAKIYGNNYISSILKDPARYVGVAIDLSKHLEPDDKSKLQEYLQKVAFCMYGICKEDSRKKVGDYMRLAYAINTDHISLEEIKNDLTTIIRDYPVNYEIDRLVRNNCYKGWQPNLRYLLYCYEKYLKKNNDYVTETPEHVERLWDSIFNMTPAQSIEHILPKKHGKPYVHWLGNLFLLSPRTNSRLRALPPKDKREYYNNTGFLMANEIVEFFPSWDEPEIINRGEKIAQWMKNEWGSLTET